MPGAGAAAGPAELAGDRDRALSVIDAALTRQDGDTDTAWAADARRHREDGRRLAEPRHASRADRGHPRTIRTCRFRAVQNGPVPVVPNPGEGAALRQLGVLRTDELPMLAAQWLVELDSPALRRLAGLDESDGWLIDQVWPEVLADLGVATAAGEQAWDLAITFLVGSWRAGDRTTLDVLREVIRAYIDNDYLRYAPEAGHLYDLDDELDGGRGRPRREVLAEIEQTLAEWAARLNPAGDG
jgi:hypothetical protein